MINPADFTKIFFEALSFPDFMRTNFYMIKQKESGWAKGVFLMALSEVYHGCENTIQYYINTPKNRALGLTKEQIEIPIKQITNGDEANNFTLEIIEELFLAVRRGWYFDRVEKQYSDLEILSFAEYSLGFIRDEFRREASKLDLKGAGENAGYLVYSIAQDAPFIDFPKFKNSFRNLMLNSQNLEKLKEVLKPFHSAAREIVKLYNEKIYKLEVNNAIEKMSKGPELVRIEFNSKELRHSRWLKNDHFDILSPSIYLNNHLASFAEQISNLLAQELLKSSPVKMRTSLADFNSDFAAGIHMLLKNDTDAGLIRNLKSGKRNRLEAPFRDYFNTWFAASRYKTYMESLKGSGRIDLKVVHPEIGEKIIEFKGWWNRDKEKIIHQVYNYLTQFEGEGYILMVNPNKSSIVDKYKAIVTHPSTNFIKNSWQPFSYGSSAFTYFKTLHAFKPNQKTVHHFIIDIH